MAISYSSTVNVPANLFDRTGVNDITDALTAWLNDMNNVPQGTSATVHTRVLFPRFQADGTTRAKYRVEGGVQGGGCVLGITRVNITLDGGGTPGNRGLDGAQFVQTVKTPYSTLADPTLNPRGIWRGDGTTSAANNTLTALVTDLTFVHVGDEILFVPFIEVGYTAGTTYAFDARVATGGGPFRMYQSLAANNLNHPPASSPTWWRDLGLFSALRTVTAVNVGGNVGQLNYSGTTLGNYLGPPLVNGTAHEYMKYVIQPRGQWNTTYTPTGATNATFSGSNANGTAYEIAANHTTNVNGSRSFFKMQKCTHLRFAHMQITGSYDGSGYSKTLEGQDGMKWAGTNDCMVDDCTISQTWGNGYQVIPYDTNGTLTASIGVWYYQCTLGGSNIDEANFGRQCASYQFGGQIILEECVLGGTGRSLLDIEPTASLSRKDPRLGGLVDGVFLFNNTITIHHIGGLIGIHRDTLNVWIKGNTGFGIGSGSVWSASNMIVEDNTNTSGQIGASIFDIIRGASAVGGKNFIFRNNHGFATLDVGVSFHASHRAKVTAASNGGHTNTLTGNGSIAVDDSTLYDPPGGALVGTDGTTTITWTGKDATHLLGVTGHGPDKVLLTGMPLPFANGCQNYTVTGNDFGRAAQFRDDNDPAWQPPFVPFPPPTPVHAMRDAIANDSVVVAGVQAVENDQGLAGTVTVNDTSSTGKYYIVR